VQDRTAGRSEGRPSAAAAMQRVDMSESDAVVLETGPMPFPPYDADAHRTPAQQRTSAHYLLHGGSCRVTDRVADLSPEASLFSIALVVRRPRLDASATVRAWRWEGK
jgi:hypothetical protein